MTKAKIAPKKAIKKTTTVEKEKIIDPVVEATDPVEVQADASQVMTKKSRNEKIKITPTIVDTEKWKIHVKAINSNWSFDKWKEYRVSQRLLESYQWTFEILE